MSYKAIKTLLRKSSTIALVPVDNQIQVLHSRIHQLQKQCSQLKLQNQLIKKQLITSVDCRQCNLIRNKLKQAQTQIANQTHCKNAIARQFQNVKRQLTDNLLLLKELRSANSHLETQKTQLQEKLKKESQDYQCLKDKVFKISNCTLLYGQFNKNQMTLVSSQILNKKKLAFEALQKQLQSKDIIIKSLKERIPVLKNVSSEAKEVVRLKREIDKKLGLTHDPSLGTNFLLKYSQLQKAIDQLA